MQVTPATGIAQYIFPGIVILVVLALRMRSVNRPRPLKLGQLWIIPAIYAVLVVAILIASPPTGLGWSVLLAALVVGAIAGWQRGKLMHIEVDPATDSLIQRPSRTAILFLVALILVRFTARSMVPAGGAGGMRGSAMLLTDGLLGFALGLLSATRVEMYLRGKRLLGAAGFRNDA